MPAFAAAGAYGVAGGSVSCGCHCSSCSGCGKCQGPLVGTSTSRRTRLHTCNRRCSNAQTLLSQRCTARRQPVDRHCGCELILRRSSCSHLQSSIWQSAGRSLLRAHRRECISKCTVCCADTTARACHVPCLCVQVRDRLPYQRGPLVELNPAALQPT